MNQKLFGILYVFGILASIKIANELYKHSQFGKRQQAETEKYQKIANDELAKFENGLKEENLTALKQRLKDLEASKIIEKWTPETLRNPFDPTEK